MWADKEYAKAEKVVTEAATPSPPQENELICKEARLLLSEEARTMLETYLQLDELYATNPDLRALDCGPLVGTMSKVCERILSDFLGPKCRMIMGNREILRLFRNPKCVLSIPSEDQEYHPGNYVPHTIKSFWCRSLRQIADI